MAALLSFPFSLCTSPSSADHLHHPLHLPTHHVPIKLLLSYSQAPTARLSGAKHLQQQGSVQGAGSRHGPSSQDGEGNAELYQPYCKTDSRCDWTNGAEGQLSFPSPVLLPLLSNHRKSQCNGELVSSVVGGMAVHPQKEKLEDNNMTSHVRGLCSPEIKTLQISRDRWLMGGWLSLPCSCYSVKDSQYLVLSFPGFLLGFGGVFC